ncbi:carbohydrate ABC transporter permease [Paenibacillus lemnae]|uniref:Carbohydrate ABC transporter permease n=2 Tax=Paenibacillus lemnae TaxID=1330551 RepID=A0A848M184_PAELE|nr:carbohydrate ABC transporter permease [Paenibacillus lemnae]
MNRTRTGSLLQSSWQNPLLKTKHVLFGLEVDKGLLFKLFLYVLLIDTAFIYLNPIFTMVTTMIKNAEDLTNPSVIWIPNEIYLGVLQEAWDMLNYSKGFLISALMSTTVALLQTLSCAVAGYAFARLKIPFKNFWFFCLLLTFIVPPQITILPNIIAANHFGIMQTAIPIILPALFGHGLKGALFVIIYRQFFLTQPKELEEAAKIDGAHIFKVFFKVMFPLARPAMVVVFLFSFVWTWNDYYLPSMYLYNSEVQPLSQGISAISQQLEAEAELSGPSVFQDSIKMATGFLMILPLLILYMFTQRKFVEGVERTGLVE